MVWDIGDDPRASDASWSDLPRGCTAFDHDAWTGLGRTGAALPLRSFPCSSRVFATAGLGLDRDEAGVGWTGFHAAGPGRAFEAHTDAGTGDRDAGTGDRDAGLEAVEEVFTDTDTEPEAM